MARCYRLLLGMYPPSYRREYGALMEQLFRDQCREALNQRGRRGLVGLWRNVLIDFIVSVSREHLAQIVHAMKTNNVDKLSLTLLAVAVLLAAVASPALVTSGLAPVTLYLSTLALLARAGVECYRAPGEWLRGLLWMAGMMVIYGVIMPFWAKMHALHGNAYPSVPIVDGGAMFLNAMVALIRPLTTRLLRRPDGPLP